MSALQLRALLEHVTNQQFHGVKFCYFGGRLYIIYLDDGFNKFYRSFGTDGTFTEHDYFSFTIEGVAT